MNWGVVACAALFALIVVLTIIDAWIDYLAWKRDPQAYIEYKKWKHEKDREDE